MSLTTTSSLPNAPGLPRERPLLSPRGWAWLAVLGLLFFWVYKHYLFLMFLTATKAPYGGLRMVLDHVLNNEWNHDWSHALAMPLISIYYLAQHRQELTASPAKSFWPGLLVLLAGLLSFAFWITPGKNHMLQGYSMLLSLFGLLLFTLGLAKMRLLWFPIAILAFGIKVSDRLWESITWKLQTIAAPSAAILLRILGVDANNRGTTIDLTFTRQGSLITESLNVAEACAGLRALMVFLALGAAMAFLFKRPWWQRLAIVILALPIAVLVNIFRVTVLGLLYLVNPAMAQGQFHTFVGLLVMLVLAFALFWLVGWIMDQIIIRTDEAPPTPSPAIPAQPASTDVVRGPAAPTTVVIGVVAGGALMLLTGLIYGLSWLIWIPKHAAGLLGGFELSQGGLATVLVINVVLLIAGVVLLSRWLSRRGTQAQPMALAVAAGVLLVAALGRSAVVGATGAVLLKQKVDLREELYRVPEQLGTWKVESEQQHFSEEILDALGTRKYISRVYRDTAYPEDQPGGRAWLHVAYYTGKADTVPHVPERCYVAGGLTPINKASTTVKLTGPEYQPDPDNPDGALASSRVAASPVRIPRSEVPTTLFTFSSENGAGQASNVIYFFVANGDYYATPDQVRALGFNPRDQYSYYCKVEVNMAGVADSRLAVERATALLSVAMPEIMACLPDWVEVTAGRWPPPSAK